MTGTGHRQVRPGFGWGASRASFPAGAGPGRTPVGAGVNPHGRAWNGRVLLPHMRSPPDPHTDPHIDPHTHVGV